MKYDLPLREVSYAALVFENNVGERVTFGAGRDGISVECASDWAGDTETGFGEYVSQCLSHESAQALLDWLTRILASQSNDPS